jgi:hypothetical protein
MEAAIAQVRKSLSEGGIPTGSALARTGALLASVTINAFRTRTR